MLIRRFRRLTQIIKKKANSEMLEFRNDGCSLAEVPRVAGDTEIKGCVCSGANEYMYYVERLNKHYNAVDEDYLQRHQVLKITQCLHRFNN